MDQSIGSATHVYQTHSPIYVTNHCTPKKDPLMWAKAFASGSVESMTFFDNTMRLILYNNKFGTLDAAEAADLRDLYSLFNYYGKFYRNAADCLKIVRQVFTFRMPEKFVMENHSGWTCNCRACPVLDGMQLGGVVLLAHRDGSALPIGEYLREQQSTRA